MAYTKEKRLINQINGKVQKKNPIATDMFLPNHSGDHSAGIVNSTPINNSDIVNKAYADSLITSLYSPLTSGYIPYYNGTALANSGAYWDSVNSRVGIGRTNPSSLLHLDGNNPTLTFFNGVDDTQVTIGAEANGSLTINADPDNALGNTAITLKTDNATAMTIDSSQDVTFSGKVGIGTATNGLKISAESGYVDVIGQDVGSSDYNNVRIRATTGNDLVIAKTTGNVGIGTATPAEKLDVNGKTLFRAGSAQDGTGTYSTNLEFTYGGGESYKHWIRTRHRSYAENNAFDFYTCDGTAAGTFPTNAVHGMSIMNGKVGIGTSSPNEKLTVEGVTSIKEQAAAPSNTAAYGKLWVKNTTPCELWFTDDAGTSTKIV